MIALVPWRALGLYFAWVLGAMLAAQALTIPTLVAVKSAPPWAVAITGSTASAVAAVIDWFFVRRALHARWLVSVRRHRLFERAERWAKVAPFFTVFAFAALPLPFWIVRVMMPATGYPLPRYAAATALGRLPRIFVIATFGTIIEIPTWILVGFFVGGVVLAVLAALARHLGWIKGAPAGPGGLPPSQPETAPPSTR